MVSSEVPPDVQALARLSLFGALSHDTIAFLLERCEHVEVGGGKVFFEQGETGDAVYVLRRGRVEIVRSVGGRSLVLSELGAGACFGEMALVGISPRCATVRALEDCAALKLRNLALLGLYERDLEQFTLIQMNLGREVARRLAAADAALLEQAVERGDPRLMRASEAFK